MDLLSTKEKLIQVIKEYRYILIVLCAGIILIMIPTTKKESEGNQKQTQVLEIKEESLEEQLEEILSCIYGAGKVRVLLTEARSERLLFQSDSNISAGGSENWDTVLITDASREQKGLIQQVIAPAYQGAIIICQGADRAEIRLMIVDAVAKVTGLTTDKITVVKMK